MLFRSEAFRTLCRFVEEARFSNLGVFAYSPEDGSGAEGLDGEVDPGVAEDRRDELMALQEPITAELLAAQVGTRQRVLVCGRDEDGSWYGRTAGQAPDIDGVTLFADHDGARLEQLRGTLVDVEITGSEGIDLFAELA